MKKMLSSLGLVLLFGATAFVLNSHVANADEQDSFDRDFEKIEQQYTNQNQNDNGQANQNNNDQSNQNSNDQNDSSKNQSNGSNNTSNQPSDNKSEQNNQPQPAPKKQIAYAKYTVKSARSYNARVVSSNNARLFSDPYNEGVKYYGKPQLKGQLVQVIRVAKSPQDKNSVNRSYYQISYRGQIRGWMNTIYLKKTSVYEIPFTYTSQHFPIDAPNGCEATALKMALSAKNVGLNKDLNAFIKAMPRAKYDQNKGFVGNPYAVNHTNQNWTIYPRALAKFGRKFRKYVYNITGASKNKIIYEVKHGNPVIAATGYRMRKATGHTLVVVGYKRGYFKMADPSSRRGTFKHKNNLPVFWVSTSQFMKLYNHEGRKAVLIH